MPALGMLREAVSERRQPTCLILSAMPQQEVTKRTWLYIAAPLAVVVAIAVGAFSYLGERSSREGYISTGDFSGRDRVDLTMVNQRVETSAKELVLQLRVSLSGGYGVDGDSTKPAKDLTVDIPSANSPHTTFPANERVTAKEVRIPLYEGVVSDFPLDNYKFQIYVEVNLGGSLANVTLSYTDHDPYFLASADGGSANKGAVFADLVVKRSNGTVILAWFQVIVMWALALAVLAAAIHIISRKLGLPWPALGWMAATLFALVGFRNATPGSPPIGSVIDYCAFFWAEALVSLSLVLVVVKGIRLKK